MSKQTNTKTFAVTPVARLLRALPTAPFSRGTFPGTQPITLCGVDCLVVFLPNTSRLNVFDRWLREHNSAGHWGNRVGIAAWMNGAALLVPEEPRSLHKDAPASASMVGLVAEWVAGHALAGAVGEAAA